MASADWSIVVGFLIYFIALIIAIIYYVMYRKLSLILYVASIATFVFSIFYAIDVFELNRHWILLILAGTTGIFFFLGKYFKNVSYTSDKHISLDQVDDNEKKGNKRKND